jgi:hypothetical protein
MNSGPSEGFQPRGCRETSVKAMDLPVMTAPDCPVRGRIRKSDSIPDPSEKEPAFICIFTTVRSFQLLNDKLNKNNQDFLKSNSNR